MNRLQNSTGISAIAFMLLAAPAASGHAVRWESADGGNGHWYEAIAKPSDLRAISWPEAKALTDADPNWYLATITSAEENAFVFDLVDDPLFWRQQSAYHGPFLGGFSSTDASNDWQWVTGELWDYENWGPAFASDGKYLHFRNGVQVPDPGWNDLIESFKTHGFVIESSETSQPAPLHPRWVPEPAAVGMLAMGAIGFGFYRRRS